MTFITSRACCTVKYMHWQYQTWSLCRSWNRNIWLWVNTYPSTRSTFTHSSHFICNTSNTHDANLCHVQQFPQSPWNVFFLVDCQPSILWVSKTTDFLCIGHWCCQYMGCDKLDPFVDCLCQNTWRVLKITTEVQAPFNIPGVPSCFLAGESNFGLICYISLLATETGELFVTILFLSWLILCYFSGGSTDLVERIPEL